MDLARVKHICKCNTSVCNLCNFSNLKLQYCELAGKQLQVNGSKHSMQNWSASNTVPTIYRAANLKSEGT